MGGAGRDLAAIGLGITDEFTDTALKNLFARRESERQTRVSTANTATEEGLFHQFDDKTMKALSGGDKDLMEALSFRSQIKAAELAPRRQAQQDIASLINAPITQQVRPAQPVAQAVQTAQPGAPTTPLAQAVQAQPLPRTRVEGTEIIEPQFTTQIPARVEQITPRAATSAERVQRLQGLQPMIAAIVLGDPQYGTLQLGQRQIDQKKQDLLFRKKKAAFTQRMSMFENIQEILAPDGRRVKVMPIHQEDGSFDLPIIGETPESGQIARLSQKLSLGSNELAKGNLDPVKKAELQRRMEIDALALEKLMKKGGVTINNEPPAVAIDPETGEITFGSAGKTARTIMDKKLEALYGSPAEIKKNRELLSTGALVMAQIGDVREAFQPVFFGLPGTLLRLTEKAIANVQGGEQFLAMIRGQSGGGAQAFDTTNFQSLNADGTVNEKRTQSFRQRMQQRLKGRVGAFDRMVDLLVINNLKLRDPSVVREGEYEREIRNMTRSGGQGFLAALEALEIDTLRRMEIAAKSNQAVNQRIQFQLAIEQGRPAEEAAKLLTVRDPSIQPLDAPVEEVLTAAMERRQERLASGGLTHAQMLQRVATSEMRELAAQEGVDLSNEEVRRNVSAAMMGFLGTENGQNATPRQRQEAFLGILADPNISDPTPRGGAQGAPQAPTGGAAVTPTPAQPTPAQPTPAQPAQAEPVTAITDPLAGAPPQVRATLERLDARARQILGTGQPIPIAQVPVENREALMEAFIRSEAILLGIQLPTLGRAGINSLMTQINELLANKPETGEEELRSAIRRILPTLARGGR